MSHAIKASYRRSLLLALALAPGCLGEPRKPMDEPLGAQDVLRADEEMRGSSQALVREREREQGRGTTP